MSLVALIAALLLEQWRPLADRRYLFRIAENYAGFFEKNLNTGEPRHGAIAWLLAVLPIAIATWIAFVLAARLSPLAALAFNVAVLYLTMGFRQFSHYFTELHLALKQGDTERARAALAAWLGRNCDGLGTEEIVRVAIEQAFAASHRHVFAVVFWFVALPGPSGAVLYRLARYLARRWGGGGPELARFGEFARRAFGVLDWLPARFTAIAFAVVGDFEDAIYCWRTQAARWPDPSLGVVLAAGAGAIGVRLGMPLVEGGEVVDRPELGLGDTADVAFLDSTVGLVWRALVMWLILLLLLGIASLAG